ncbi:ROK family protein [Brucepastera parasyntrophica]|uniref:ROK family protein n=1 Tax=Brucepastera parasyntrophica TaxID=2880008 RepID=UPI00210D0BED|nr:ROK family protein [Brucepastera parasyntrophica]
MQTVLDLVTRAKKSDALQNRTLLGIGIGFPGIVDSYTGTILRSRSLGISEPFDFRTEIEKQCNEYVIIENDANCCCWGELAFHTENRTRNFISVLGEFRSDTRGDKSRHGFSLGLGLVLRDRVLHGDHFTAGEFRSIYASDDTGQFSIPYTELESIPEDRNMLHRVYQELAENLAFLVNCVDFTKVVFAGDIAGYPENLAENLSRAIERGWSFDNKREFVIEFSEYGDRAVCSGAAGLFAEKLFSIPDIADHFHEIVGYDLYEHLRAKGTVWNI